LDELATDGVELVFNTPNRQSLPGYLKMGWREVGRLPAAVRPTRWRFAAVAATARRAAGRAGVPSSVGVPAAAGLVALRAVGRRRGEGPRGSAGPVARGRLSDPPPGACDTRPISASSPRGPGARVPVPARRVPARSLGMGPEHGRRRAALRGAAGGAAGEARG